MSLQSKFCTSTLFSHPCPGFLTIPVRISDDPAAHKNEGWMKSIWHTLTNHPAHQGKPADSENSDTSGKDSTGASKDTTKDNDGNKKESGSGSA